MNLKIISIASLACSLILSSCLKDTPYMNVADSPPIIEFGLSPANGVSGPFTYAGDTASGSNIDTAIALVIASPQVLNYNVTVTVAIDTTQITAYDIANSAGYTMLPSNLFTLDSTTVTIQAGYRVANLPITLNLQNFPATHNYALPLKITNGDGLIISSNSSDFMWLFSR
jgi:hypothetical protein